MTTTPQTVRQLARFDLLGQHSEALPVRVELRYDSRDPFAVHAVFKAGPHTVYTEDVEWCFARDLLVDGLIAEAGSGDVLVRPMPGDPEVVEVELSSPSGHAVFATSFQSLADFLDRSYEICAPGSEYAGLDVDAALENLLADEAYDDGRGAA